MTDRAAAIAALTLLVCACGGDDDGTATEADAGRTELPPLPTDEELWTTSTIATGDVGLFTQLVVDGDRPMVAYFDVAGRDDGPCEELGGEAPPTRVIYTLHFAERTGGSWQVETALDQLVVGAPAGLDMALDGGEVVIAAATGEPLPDRRYCGVHDAGLLRRTGGSWALQTVVASSGEAATGEPASDFGEVVGRWPGLAFDGSGAMALAYKDVHGGGLQGDDLRRADLEIAVGSGTAFTPHAVDVGRSAGDFNRVVFDAAGRIVVLYYLPQDSPSETRQGVWAARSDDAGATWVLTRLHSGPTSHGLTLAVSPADGSLHAGFYDTSDGQPQHMWLDADGDFAAVGDSGWQREGFGDSRYDEGYHLSMAFDSQGQLGAAYYRCTLATAGLGECSAQDDALVFTFREFGGFSEPDVIDEGDGATGCGRYASLAFDADDRAHIAYQCAQVQGDDENLVEHRVALASREAAL